MKLINRSSIFKLSSDQKINKSEKSNRKQSKKSNIIQEKNEETTENIFNSRKKAIEKLTEKSMKERTKIYEKSIN